MDKIGVMMMPADFRYREVLRKGKPKHDRFDPFRIQHPRMDSGRRAKIFAPFDALKGFSEALRDSEKSETEKALKAEGNPEPEWENASDEILQECQKGSEEAPLEPDWLEL